MKKLVVISLGIAAIAVAATQTPRKIARLPTAFDMRGLPGPIWDAGESTTTNFQDICANLWADGGTGINGTYSSIFSSSDQPPGALGGVSSSTGWRLKRMQAYVYPMDAGSYTHYIAANACTPVLGLAYAEFSDAGIGGTPAPIWVGTSALVFNDPDTKGSSNGYALPSLAAATTARWLAYDIPISEGSPGYYCFGITMAAASNGGCNADGISHFKVNVRRTYEAIQP